MTYQLEKLYHRVRDIHEKFGGQRQGGISTPAEAPYIFLFTGEAGEQHGYSDGFEDDGAFVYTGEGQHGDMEFVRGNRAIRDHANNGKALLLFEASKKKGYYRYKGEFVAANFDNAQRGLDTSGSERRLIRFRLIPISALTAHDSLEPTDSSNSDEVKRLAGSLRAHAYEAILPPCEANKNQAIRTVYRRSQKVKDYVMARADGVCES